MKIVPITSTPTPWGFPPATIVLGGNEVHVWRASLDESTPQLDSFLHTLAADERTRAERFHFQRDRERFIIAHGVLRAILGLYLNRAPKSLSFCYSSHGKPALAGESGGDAIRFNMSHSHGCGPLCGYSWSRDRHRSRIHPLRFGSGADRRTIFLAKRDCNAPGASAQPSEIRILSLLDPQGSLHQGERRRTLHPLGSVRRVADSRRTCSVVEHPARFGRNPSLVSAGPDSRLRLRGCSCGGRTRLDSILLAMADHFAKYRVSTRQYICHFPLWQWRRDCRCLSAARRALVPVLRSWLVPRSEIER